MIQGKHQKYIMNTAPMRLLINKFIIPNMKQIFKEDVLYALEVIKNKSVNVSIPRKYQAEYTMYYW
jgi:hypothetical protein